MALTNWLFLYTAPGIPAGGDLGEVRTPESTTVLAGFPSADAALAACEGPALGSQLKRAELIELCGGFTHEHVVWLRTRIPDVPIGLVTYDGADGGRLQRVFS